VTAGFQVSESRYRSLQDDGQPPELVLPQPDAPELSVGSGGVTEQAARIAAGYIAHGLDITGCRRMQRMSSPDPVAAGPADEPVTPALPSRLAARVLVLDPDDRVLLLRYDDAPPNGRHWSTPGGGLEAGEDYATAALRELSEETGWADVTLGGEIAVASVTMEYDGRLVAQHERLYLARTDQPCRPLADVAAMHATDRIAAWRWWTLAELTSTTEVIWPAGLAGLIGTVVRPT